MALAWDCQPLLILWLLFHGLLEGSSSQHMCTHCSLCRVLSSFTSKTLVIIQEEIPGSASLWSLSFHPLCLNFSCITSILNIHPTQLHMCSYVLSCLSSLTRLWAPRGQGPPYGSLHPKSPHTTPGINSMLRIFGWKERMDRGKDRGKMAWDPLRDFLEPYYPVNLQWAVVNSTIPFPMLLVSYCMYKTWSQNLSLLMLSYQI